MNKLWLVIKNKETKITYFKYFNTIDEMEKYLHKIKFVKNLLLIEDSRDIIFI